MTRYHNNNPVPGSSDEVNGVTTDNYIVALSIISLGYAHKIVLITNTHVTAGITFKVDGYINRDSTSSYPIMGDTDLIALDNYQIEITKPYDKIELSVKSAVGSTPATYNIDHILQKGE